MQQLDGKWDLVGTHPHKHKQMTQTYTHFGNPVERDSDALEGASHAQPLLRSKLSVAQSV